MGVLVILELDGDPETLLAATAEAERLHPTDAVESRFLARSETGVVMCTLWKSAAARGAYVGSREHDAALRASGVIEAATAMRSRVFEGAELRAS